jgi:phospholipid/cholesterol/gamma-HCH transport system permease protein
VPDTPVETSVTEHELRVAARPETVFSYFTDPVKMVQWMGVDATLDPRPGGVCRIAFSPSDENLEYVVDTFGGGPEAHERALRNRAGAMLGEFVEVDPPRRIALTWGWEQELLRTPPQSTSVEVSFIPDGDDTIVRLAHRRLPAGAVEFHRHGWQHYLQRLGSPPPAGIPDTTPGKRRRMGRGWFTLPAGWLASTGDIAKFCVRVMRDVWGGRVLRFFGETLRQAGILILSSTIVICGLVFIIGLQCGIEGAYFTRSQGTPAYAGVFSAWCDLRELVPYAFGYMMAAKVGTGIVAELGSMRISDEIDALEVMGIDSMTFLCATRLLAAWIVLPFMYVTAVGAGFFASYLAVVQQIGDVSSGGFFLIFWMFQNPPDLLYSVIKGMSMATAIVLVGCYYGYNAGGGPVGVGTATAKSMVLNIVLVHLIGMLGTQVFWGANPRAPIGG